MRNSLIRERVHQRIQDVGSVGHDRPAVEADVPGEQVLRGEGARAQVRHLQDGARGLQGGPGKRESRTKCRDFIK